MLFSVGVDGICVLSAQFTDEHPRSIRSNRPPKIISSGFIQRIKKT